MIFSVIIPVHNKAPHLERSIYSVLNQSYPKFELIVIDDASSDNSLTIIESFTDSRIRIAKRTQPGPGGYAARNLGVEMANSEWISFLDADDEWEYDYLENVSKLLLNSDKCDIVATNWDHVYGKEVVGNLYFKKFTEEIVSFDLTDFFKNNYFMWTSAVTIRRTLLLKVGGFPEKRCKRGGDVDTWIRCLDESKTNLWINKTLAHYHRDTVNRVTDNKSNPVSHICSLSSIQEIRAKTKNKALLVAIDDFLAKVVYNKLISDYRRGVVDDLIEVQSIQSKIKRLSLLLKYYIRITFFEKRR